MHHLCFLTGSSDQVHNRTVSPLTDSAHPPQATPLAERLENYMYLLRLKLTTVVDCVKGVSKGMLADRAKVTLTPFASFSVFMGFIMTAEQAEHSFWGQA